MRAPPIGPFPSGLCAWRCRIMSEERRKVVIIYFPFFPLLTENFLVLFFLFLSLVHTSNVFSFFFTLLLSFFYLYILFPLKMNVAQQLIEYFERLVDLGGAHGQRRQEPNRLARSGRH